MQEEKDDLDEVMDRKPVVSQIFGHIYLTYFFTAFWAIVIYLIIADVGEIESRIPNVPPWIYIAGSIILFLKNVWRLVQYHVLGRK